MRQVMYSEFGLPEVLRVIEAPKPEPSDSQLLVKVQSVGVNPFETKSRAGLFGGDLPKYPGSDVAGTVAQVGSSVSGIEVGQAVFGFAEGGDADFALLSAYAALPEGLDPDDAVALLVPGAAARRALAAIDLPAGATVLINGATGAVGTIAVQLATAAGLTVIGTGEPESQSDLVELGALATTFGRGIAERALALVSTIDGVIDLGGHGFVAEIAPYIADPKRIVSLVDPAAKEVGGTFSTGGSEDRNVEALRVLGEMVVDGTLRLAPARRFELDDVIAAHHAVEDGGRGKVVLRP